MREYDVDMSGQIDADEFTMAMVNEFCRIDVPRGDRNAILVARFTHTCSLTYSLISRRDDRRFNRPPLGDSVLRRNSNAHDIRL